MSRETDFFYGQRVRVKPLNANRVQIGTPFVGTIVKCDCGLTTEEHTYDVKPDRDVKMDSITRDQIVGGLFLAFHNEMELLQ